ncbi:hypothetical protein Aros01_04034 [Streptosporangium roseum]|uniref:Uncharacterized protein n=1 Tax=Streptosporangium roseum (strain ATCC 12428 / DSM 43021 / JCM 3005 / KCTC 9067 / NCIMB 10171 / NRRL 2505 / NI 9100) TaxID=479432 RepID=D2BDF9_STRRD|nr:hypothetical protein Sros_3309 [Streptosporangium roseum DSM 43021]
MGWFLNVLWERSHEEWTIGNQDVNMPKLNRYIRVAEGGRMDTQFGKPLREVFGSAPITRGHSGTFRTARLARRNGRAGGGRIPDGGKEAGKAPEGDLRERGTGRGERGRNGGEGAGAGCGRREKG